MQKLLTKSAEQSLSILVIAAISSGSAQELKAPTPGGLPPFTPPAVERLFSEANERINAGDFKTANDKLGQAERRAEDAVPDPNARPAQELKTEILLRKAQLLLREPANDNTKASQLNKSLELLNQVAATNNLGSPRQQAVAHINAGQVLMLLNRPADAAARLKQFDWANVSPSELPVLHYNYGRALEESGKPLEALSEYSKSLARGGVFALGSDRINRLAPRVIEDGADSAFRVGQRLIDNGAPQSAVRLALQLLRRSADGDSKLQTELLRVLLLAWARLYADAESFNKEQEEAMNFIAPRWKLLVSDITTAMSADLSIEAFQDLAPAREEQEPIPPFLWSTAPANGTRAEFTKFLAATARPLVQHVNVTDLNSRAGDLRPVRQAFARIYIAWFANPKDLELADKLAAITHNFAPIVDPNGRFRGKLVDSIMMEKGNLYKIPVKTEKDWENLVRLHTFLGLLFEDDKKWGQESDIYSSIGQWARAIEANDQLHRLRPNANVPVPGLYEHMANCLAEKKRNQDAFRRYLQAGQEYLKDGNIELAGHVSRAAAALIFNRTEFDQADLKKLDENIKNRHG